MLCFCRRPHRDSTWGDCTLCIHERRASGGGWELGPGLLYTMCMSRWRTTVWDRELSPCPLSSSCTTARKVLPCLPRYHHTPYPANTTRWINAGLTLVHRRGRWTNVKITLIQRLVSDGHLKKPITYPANTRHSSDVVSMLGQRRRQWPNIETTFKWMLFAAYPYNAGLMLIHRLRRWTNIRPKLILWFIFALKERGSIIR